MTMSLLWYVLAGVLLGFAASTLWEWLYFRRKRMTWESARVEELEVQLADEQSLNQQMRLAHTSTQSDAAPAYASPGVFLETESEAALEAGNSSGVPAEEARQSRQDLSEGVHTDTSANAKSSTKSNLATAAPTTTSGDSVSASTGGEDRADDRTYAFADDAMDERMGIVAIELSDTELDEAVADEGDWEGDVADLHNPTDENEDDATILERLAAELAQPPDAYASAQSARVHKRPVARSTDYPDNLSKIKGIGDVYKFRLYAAGIYTWHQIAESDVPTLRAATHAYPGANVEEWPAQARELAEKNGRQDAYYTGPVPDDLTQIIGIGPVSERTLYRAGICTYDQLAGATRDELQGLFPIAIAGDEPDFGQWIRLAIEYANRKPESR